MVIRELIYDNNDLVINMINIICDHAFFRGLAFMSDHFAELSEDGLENDWSFRHFLWDHCLSAKAF